MKNGKYYLDYRLRSLTTGFLCACVVTCLIAGGCRSSRNVVQKSETTEHKEFSAYEKNDSVRGESSDTICQRDTVKGSSGECGRIDIERDTAGRPVVILWKINSDFSAEASSETLKKGLFDLRGASGSTQTSGTVDSVAQTKEETTQEVKAGFPLECLIGWGIVAFLVIYYTSDLIYRIWKRKQTK